MKDKGFDYGTIDKALKMYGVDEKIAAAREAQAQAQTQAQLENYQAMFQQAIANGRYDVAGVALANLARLDKATAAMYQTIFPTYKDNWNVDNKRKDAATNFSYQQMMSDRNNQQKLNQMAYNAQLQRALNQGKISDAQQAKLNQLALLKEMGATDEQLLAAAMGGSSGGSRSSSSTKAVTSADGNQYYSADGQPIKLSQKDLELQNALNDAWESAWGAVNNYDNAAVNGGDGGADAVNDFTRLVIDNRSKMTPEAYSHYYSLAAAAQFLREKGAGHENKAAELFAQISPDVKKTYLSQY